MTTTRHILTINPRHPAASNITELHKLVMAGYRHAVNETPQARSQLNILFHITPQRLDTTHYPPRAAHTQQLLVQADTPGNWADTPYTHDTLLDLRISPPIPVTHTFTTGDHIAIKAALNPTHSIPNHTPLDPTAKRPRGKRVPITQATDVAIWAATQFANHGLTLNRNSITVDKPVRYLGHSPNRQITIDARLITATGTITDPHALSHALTTGIGRGRAYGAGLIRHRTTT